MWGHRARLGDKTDHSIFRSFGHLVRFWIHYYQQKFKYNGKFYRSYGMCVYLA